MSFFRLATRTIGDTEETVGCFDTIMSKWLDVSLSLPLKLRDIGPSIGDIAGNVHRMKPGIQRPGDDVAPKLQVRFGEQKNCSPDTLIRRGTPDQLSLGLREVTIGVE
eukprot:gb/GECG01007072.1/.p1 GENE.gb/GECG01007072.1/~~gb/GECG01007072.1/.p1  ORF type:complete len:108 (+),score=7.26 gb/GECG01007072.1/:1-324(+)